MMSVALISSPVTTSETIAPLQGRAGLPEGTGSRGWNGRKFLAKSNTPTTPALKQSAPTLIAKPCLKIHDDHGFRIIVDAPSRAALDALRAPISSLKPTLRRRIGNICSRANSRDDEIIEMGRLAGRLFDRIVIHELAETGGRREGEISRLIAKGALQTGVHPSNIRAIAGECESAFACLRFARSGDLVALLMLDVDAGWQLVRDFKPRWKRRESSDGF
jgi:hypothetical protein